MNKRKQWFIIILMFVTVSMKVNAQDYGLKIIAGGRYDNMRMCVGSDRNVKGGPIADIMLLTSYRLQSGRKITFELPVMRPILFGVAFKMLQFEPEVTMEFDKKINANNSLVIAPGLGLSLHYGPDYKSDLDNRGDDFFAAGPFFSTLVGLKSGESKVYGLRFFYSPLFSSESNLSPGTVIGAVLEYQIDL